MKGDSFALCVDLFCQTTLFALYDWAAAQILDDRLAFRIVHRTFRRVLIWLNFGSKRIAWGYLLFSASYRLAHVTVIVTIGIWRRVCCVVRYCVRGWKKMVSFSL